MKIYDIQDKDGRFFAFEIDNSLLSHRRTATFIAFIPGIAVIRWPR